MNRKTLVIASAVVLGLLCMLMIPKMLRPKAPVGTEVLVAATDIPAGTFLQTQNLRWQTWEPTHITEAFVRRSPNTAQEMVGAVARQGIRSGEPIMRGEVVKPQDRGFLAAVLNPGMRAVAAPITATTGIAGFVFPAYRLAVVVIAVVMAIALYLLMERTRLGAMIRAGVDDPEMASAVGIPVSRLFSTVFCLGAALAGAGGVIGGPIMSAYPGLDADMLPLALIVVILGGVGSLLGAFVGAFITGFVYTFGVALLPDLAYVILFLPMILVIAFRPRGLFGKFAA